MTDNKNWFVKVDESVRRSICFVDNNMVTLKGMGNIRVKRKDGHEFIISDVLYVPPMASNLINLGQLLEKDYTMKMEIKELKVFDEMSRIMLKEPLSTKREFKVMINMIDHQCLASTTIEDKKWVWHQRFGHLNFMSLSLMHMKKMVYGLLKIEVPK